MSIFEKVAKNAEWKRSKVRTNLTAKEVIAILKKAKKPPKNARYYGTYFFNNDGTLFTEFTVYDNNNHTVPNGYENEYYAFDGLSEEELYKTITNLPKGFVAQCLYF